MSIGLSCLSRLCMLHQRCGCCLQKAKKDQDMADDGGVDPPAAAAVRGNSGAMALPADLNGPSHGNGTKRLTSHNYPLRLHVRLRVVLVSQ